MSELVTGVHEPRKCRAHSKRSGKQCQKWALAGGFVCDFHGGKAPQVKAKAERRLREMVDPMISRLHELAMQTDNLKVASDCVRDALDRAGIGEVVQAKVRASHAKQQGLGGGITVNIGFLGSNPMDSHQAMSTQPVVMSSAPVVMSQGALVSYTGDQANANAGGVLDAVFAPTFAPVEQTAKAKASENAKE